MKYYVYGCLLFLGIALTVSASDSIKLSGGNKIVGRVGVGENRGTVCALSVSPGAADIYSDRRTAIFSQFRRVNQKWLSVSEAFSMQDYGGQLFGSKQKRMGIGIQSKLTISLLLNERTQTYKAILNERSLVSDQQGKLIGDGSVGKFTVCENMVFK